MDSKEENLKILYCDAKEGFHNASKLYQKAKELGVNLQQVRELVKKQKLGQRFAATG